MTVEYKLKFLSARPIYNFIVLDSEREESVTIFNCYLRAINEGMAQLMDDCFPAPPVNVEGTCGERITEGGRDGFSGNSFFSNCTDLSLNYNVTVSSEEDNRAQNGTLLFIVDNSGLMPEIAAPKELINLILEYSVIANVNDADKAKLFLICSLTGVVIVIMVVFAFALKWKIRRLDREIREVKGKKGE